MRRRTAKRVGVGILANSDGLGRVEGILVKIMAVWTREISGNRLHDLYLLLTVLG